MVDEAMFYRFILPADMAQSFTALVLNDLNGQTPTVRKALRATTKKIIRPCQHDVGRGGWFCL